jgi:hypothetical protein
MSLFRNMAVSFDGSFVLKVGGKMKVILSGLEYK